MKKYIIYIMLLSLMAGSCGKTITPSGNSRQSKLFDEDQFNYIYVEAIKQKLMGNGAEALKYFEQCIQMNPESDASFFQVAQILLNTGDLNNGKKFALKAVEIYPDNIWYLLMLAGTYYQGGNIDSAIIYYEKAVTSSPDRESLLLTLGNLYSQKGSYEKATSIFDAFDKKYGVNKSSTVSAINNLMTEKKYDEALAKAELLLKDSPDEILYNGLIAEIYRGKGMASKAMEVYNQLIERHPDDPDIQLSLCDFLINEKSYEELLMLLNNVFINEKVTRENKVALAARMLELPDLIEIYGNKFMLGLMVLEANYKNDDIIPLLRADLLVKQKKPESASELLEKVIINKPDSYYAWEKLLLIYLEEGNYKMLMERGKDGATRFNRSFLVKILYANGAIENGEYSIALEELRKAEILAGDDKEALNQVSTMRADIYYRMKDYEKAFAIFEEAVKNNSEDLTVLNNYAYYLAEQDMKLKEAEQMAKKVIETEKNNTTFLDTYAWVLYKRGKLKEAANIMEEIINSGEKDDAEWYEHYGYILKKQKKCEMAVEYWQRAIDIDSSKTNLLTEIENCRK